MVLFVNVFADGDVLLEFDPQGDDWIPLVVSDEDAEVLAMMITSPETSAALARLFLAGMEECRA